MLGGINFSYQVFFNFVDGLTEKKLYKALMQVMLFISHMLLLPAKNFGIKPLITPAFVRKYNMYWIVSSAKTEKKLG